MVHHYFKLLFPIGTVLIRRCNRPKGCCCYKKYHCFNAISMHQFNEYQLCRVNQEKRYEEWVQEYK